MPLESYPEAGVRVKHKVAGAGTVEKLYEQFNASYRGLGIVFVKLDNPPPNWMQVCQFDMESLEEAE